MSDDDKAAIRARLEELRVELRAERISYGELIELQGLAEHIDPSDVELLEAAGVPERNAPLFKTYTELRDFLDLYTNERGEIQGDPATIAAEAAEAGHVAKDPQFHMQHDG